MRRGAPSIHAATSSRLARCRCSNESSTTTMSSREPHRSTQRNASFSGSMAEEIGASAPKGRQLRCIWRDGWRNRFLRTRRCSGTRTCWPLRSGTQTP